MKPTSKSLQPDSTDLKLRVRNAAEKYPDDDNINSIGIGYRVKNGVKTKELCVQFTVEKKLSLPVR